MRAVGLLGCAAGLLLTQPAPAAPECVGWKATAGCDAMGPRDPKADQPCEAVIQMQSGFCECAITDATTGNVTVDLIATECDGKPFRCLDACNTQSFFGDAQPSEAEARITAEKTLMDDAQAKLKTAGEKAIEGVEHAQDAARRAREAADAEWIRKGGNAPAWKQLDVAAKSMTAAGATLTAAADQVVPVLTGTLPTVTTIT